MDTERLILYYLNNKISDGTKVYDASTEGRTDTRLYEIEARGDKESRKYAVKIIPFGRAEEFEESTELDFYNYLHDNYRTSHLITPIGYYQEPDSELYLIMPYVEGTPLTESLKKEDSRIEDGTLLGIPFALSFAHGAGKAFQGLRDTNVIHGDLGLRHFLVGSDNEVYMFDFETVKERSSQEEREETRLREELLYFETLGQLLLSHEEGKQVYAKFQLIHLQKTGIDTEQLKRIMLKSTQFLIDFFETELGTSSEKIIIESNRTKEKYNLIGIEEAFKGFDISYVTTIVNMIEKKYGEEFARFYAEHVRTCLTDPQWNFVQFAHELQSHSPHLLPR